MSDVKTDLLNEVVSFNTYSEESCASKKETGIIRAVFLTQYGALKAIIEREDGHLKEIEVRLLTVLRKEF